MIDIKYTQRKITSMVRDILFEKITMVIFLLGTSLFPNLKFVYNSAQTTVCDNDASILPQLNYQLYAGASYGVIAFLLSVCLLIVSCDKTTSIIKFIWMLHILSCFNSVMVFSFIIVNLVANPHIAHYLCYNDIFNLFTIYSICLYVCSDIKAIRKTRVIERRIFESQQSHEKSVNDETGDTDIES